MRPDNPYGVPASPPKDSQARVFGYNLQTGETVLPRPMNSTHRPMSRGRWDLGAHQATASVSSRSTDTPLTRYHPDPTRPTLSDHRYGSYSDTNSYPPPPDRPLGGDGSPRLPMLEDQIRRLTAALHEERADNARSHLNTTSYMLQMLDWISGQAGRSIFLQSSL